ncbi:MAG: MBL fold metallo-hydrolase [Bacteroidetes bacterium]|nr:MBL fold metallo-hydrolase [Bacteroidota bacterium]
MLFRQIFEPKLAQYAYLIGCQKTKEAIIIDPLRDIDTYVRLAEAENVNIVAVAETHIHADFLSGAREFAEQHGTRVYVSDEGREAGWASEWADPEKYDIVRLSDNDTFKIGNIKFRAVHSPGHTPEHVSYLVTDEGGGATTPMGIASGDFVFVGDLVRPDLLESAAGIHGMMESSAHTLFGSLPKFTSLEDHLQVWPAHGAGSACGKALGAVPQSTVGYEKRYNASLGAAAEGEDEFVGAILSGQPEPPLYFARMKRDNRAGVPVLNGMPGPRAYGVADLRGVIEKKNATIIDARIDREGFMDRHIVGSIYAPMNRTFSQVVGSLIEDETTPLVLIVNETQLDEGLRDLVRIGYDNIIGYLTPDTLMRYFEEENGGYASIPTLRWDEFEMLRKEGDAVLDVRFAAEFNELHIPGAINASYTRLPTYLDRLPKDKTLLVHCRTGARAAAAASYLAKEGYDVKYVDDLIESYHLVGPVETGEVVVA